MFGVFCVFICHQKRNHCFIVWPKQFQIPFQLNRGPAIHIQKIIDSTMFFIPTVIEGVYHKCLNSSLYKIWLVLFYSKSQ